MISDLDVTASDSNIDWRLQDMASSINAKVVAETAALTDAWRRAMITLNVTNEVWNKLWLQVAFFGVFLLEQRFSKPLAPEESSVVNRAVRQAFIDIVPIVAFAEPISKDLTDYIADGYDRALDAYRSYEGADRRNLARAIFQVIFNEAPNSRIRFVQDNFATRLRLRSALLLGTLGDALSGDPSFTQKHGNEVFLSADKLMLFVNDVVEAFGNIQDNEIVSS